jgi:hypothetical protein
MNFLQHVSETIKALRGNMSQESLGAEIGVAANTISR